MPPLHYVYKHTSTEATTGYFACEPEPAMGLEESLNQLVATPYDDFLHRHLLRSLVASTLDELQVLWRISLATPQKDILAVLLLECAVLNPDHAPLAQIVTCKSPWQDLTPLPYLAWNTLPDKDNHSAWSTIFNANITEHEKLPHPDEIEDEGLLPLYADDMLSTAKAPLPSIAELYATHKNKEGMAWARPPAQETAQRALTLLVDNAILDGVEMRHEASLSPIALLRPWAVRMQINNGRHAFSVEGQAHTYGRGLSLANARASYAMEMIERASTYVSVQDNRILHRDGHMPLYLAKYSELVAGGHTALDPNALPLESPYDDAPLYWLEARKARPVDAPSHMGEEGVFIPAQYVFLFSNLDERSLLMNPGSTGLASGNSLAEAKVAALTEILERDAEATMPYDRARCFVLKSKDERLQALFDDYEARGIYVHFMDITTEFGIPCYQSFVLDKKGGIIRATGASLSGKHAALSALTEVPFAYPNGPASGPAIKGLPVKFLEDLPEYSLDSPTKNLAFLEDLLQQHGYTPLYVDITHEDLEMPVVRALIPGLELSAEWDSFSRICPRLYANYLRMFAE